MNDKFEIEIAQKTNINIDELNEVQYWSEKLIVNQSEIIEAVKKVGSNVENVKKYFNQIKS